MALQKLTKARRLFRRDERGVVAILFGLTALPVVALAGAGVDYGRALSYKTSLQSAADAAALTAARELLLRPKNAEAKGRKVGLANFADNTNPHVRTPAFSFVLDDDELSANVTGRMVIDTMLLGVVGMNEIDIAVESNAEAGLSSLEVAVVVDTSGSMKSDMSALRTSLDVFADVMEKAGETSDVFLSLVPYAAAVNVGGHHRNASWIDGEATSPLHGQDFDEAANRFELFDEMGVDWAGCVMARPGRYRLSIAPPNASDPASSFVPMFAPDEPGAAGSKTRRGPDDVSYPNSYLDDDGGVCATDSDEALSDSQRQRRVCKYKGAKIKFKRGSRTTGPNWRCTSQPLTPLTNAFDTFRRNAKSLRANGGTNITEGLLWGWQTLTPTGPFDKAKEPAELDNQKIVILMTDGEGNIDPSDKKRLYKGINWSRYTPYGFLSHGALGSEQPKSRAAVEALMRDDLDFVCSNVKGRDIQVWSIVYNVDDRAPGVKTMRDCASSADQFVAPKSRSDLEEVFPRIAERLTKVRLTH